jgi:NADPH-dependent curcumin reductase CurA
MTLNRQWVLAKRPDGPIGSENFDYVEAEMPEPNDDEVLIRNLYVSFDPTQRNMMIDQPGYLPPVELGAPMRAATVGQVVSSRNAEFAEGELVQATGCWQDFVAISPKNSATGVTKLPAGVPPEMMLSVLGITGLTAYFGMLDIGQVQAGETVLVSGAAGATGSIAGQIAKLKGCRVVGIAGGARKCAWLQEEAGFDAVIDYKSENVVEQIQVHCPDKWDVFFDNVGGTILQDALEHINLRGRVVLCGAISGYNTDTPSPCPSNLMKLVTNRGRMEGFIILDFLDRAQSAAQEILSWIQAGDIAYKIDLQEGFENIPSTLLRLFSGQNFGKQLLKIADPV